MLGCDERRWLGCDGRERWLGCDGRRWLGCDGKEMVSV